MQFKGINNYKNIKYIVNIESLVTKDQKITRKEKTFEQIEKAISYIKYLKAEIKKFPKEYPNSRIIMEKIIIKSNTYEVLEGK